MKRKVTYAKLHDLNLVVPGVGVLTKELPPQNKTLPNFSMTYSVEGLLLSIAGKEYLIPSANVQFMSLAPEEKPSK